MDTYARLGQAVLRTAMVDARRGGLEARTFLKGGAMLDFWCSVADVSMERVMALAHERWPEWKAA